MVHKTLLVPGKWQTFVRSMSLTTAAAQVDLLHP